MEKSPDAFRTISEVADWLNTPAHVLRFWESRFSQIKPVKRAGGRRYYRPADMALLGGIKKLLHDDGMTIRGVQKLLRENGVRYVAAMSPEIDGVAPITPPPLADTVSPIPKLQTESTFPSEPTLGEHIPEAPMAEDVPIGAFDTIDDLADSSTVVPFSSPLDTPAPTAQPLMQPETLMPSATDTSIGSTTATDELSPPPKKQPMFDFDEAENSEISAENELDLNVIPSGEDVSPNESTVSEQSPAALISAPQKDNPNLDLKEENTSSPATKFPFAAHESHADKSLEFSASSELGGTPPSDPLGISLDDETTAPRSLKDEIFEQPSEALEIEAAEPISESVSIAQASVETSPVDHMASGIEHTLAIDPPSAPHDADEEHSQINVTPEDVPNFANPLHESTDTPFAPSGLDITHIDDDPSDDDPSNNAHTANEGILGQLSKTSLQSADRTAVIALLARADALHAKLLNL